MGHGFTAGGVATAGAGWYRWTKAMTPAMRAPTSAGFAVASEKNALAGSASSAPTGGAEEDGGGEGDEWWGFP